MVDHELRGLRLGAAPLACRAAAAAALVGVLPRLYLPLPVPLPRLAARHRTGAGGWGRRSTQSSDGGWGVGGRRERWGMPPINSAIPLSSLVHCSKPLVLQVHLIDDVAEGLLLRRRGMREGT